MKVYAYLSFEGRCEEAMEFYRTALGAEVEKPMRFKDAPADGGTEGMTPPGMEDKILHVGFKVGETEVMASDGMCSGEAKFYGTALALAAPGVAETERLFHALADGGTVTMPLAKTFWTQSFGIVKDRFGVEWMLMAEGEPTP